MEILIVLPSHGQVEDAATNSSFCAEDFAAAYYTFTDAGATVRLASPQGGQPPLLSYTEQYVNEISFAYRFAADKYLHDLLASTTQLSKISSINFDAVFYCGGHGILWNLVYDLHSILLIEAFARQYKPMALVCHGAAALINAHDIDGKPMLKGKRITAFSNSEEDAPALMRNIPFLLEDELKNKGAIYSKKEDGAANVVKDGLLITGQNPASAAAAASSLLQVLDEIKVLAFVYE